MIQARAPYRTIGSRYPTAVADAVAADAARLGLTVSDWMRMAVELTLAARLDPTQAASYRTEPNRRPGRTNGA